MEQKTNGPDIWVKFKIGKKEFYKISMIDILHFGIGKSKSELKRLFKEKAIDIFYEYEE